MNQASIIPSTARTLGNDGNVYSRACSTTGRWLERREADYQFRGVRARAAFPSTTEIPFAATAEHQTSTYAAAVKDVFLFDSGEISEREWLAMATAAFADLIFDDEDLYTVEDGVPYDQPD